MEQAPEIKNIPLIVTTFNLPTYTENIVRWFSWYYPENPIYVIDNAANTEISGCNVVKCQENNCAANLKAFLSNNNFEYYLISDPDIMPHPKTPPFFLEVFKHLIDTGFHHAGFGLITDDIPDWNEQHAFLQGVENDFRKPEQAHTFDFNGISITGHKAPIDTTFALYTSKNSGWHAPMNGADWGNSIRVFDAFHLPWYQHPDYINPEMDNYFKTATYWSAGDQCSAGVNHYRPTKYNK